MHHTRTGRPARRGAALGGTPCVVAARSRSAARGAPGRRGAGAPASRSASKARTRRSLEATTVASRAAASARTASPPTAARRRARPARSSRDPRQLEGDLVEVAEGLLRVGDRRRLAASSGGAYWAFWIDDAPASAGICGIDPKAGQHPVLPRLLRQDVPEERRRARHRGARRRPRRQAVRGHGDGLRRRERQAAAGGRRDRQRRWRERDDRQRRSRAADRRARRAA